MLRRRNLAICVPKYRAVCTRWLSPVGNQVIIPPPGRQQILSELHNGHPGVARMKSLAQMYV